MPQGQVRASKQASKARALGIIWIDFISRFGTESYRTTDRDGGIKRWFIYIYIHFILEFAICYIPYRNSLSHDFVSSLYLHKIVVVVVVLVTQRTYKNNNCTKGANIQPDYDEIIY